MFSWDEVAKNFRLPHAIWNKSKQDENPAFACNRIFDGEAKITVRPKFTVPSDTSFFTIGSCFARNIEMALIDRGLQVNNALYNSKDFAQRENKYGDAALLHRFNVPSMKLEIDNYSGGDERLGEHLIYPLPEEGMFWDSNYANNQMPRPFEKIVEDRAHLRHLMRESLSQAGCMIITLGLSEALFDNETSLPLNSAPPARYARKSNRFSGVWVSMEEALEGLEAIRTKAKATAGDQLNIIVTVSPVGLQRSFTGQDVVVANTLSKAQLRVAASKFSDAHDDVDYFPSYEFVTLSHPKTAWQNDRRHVKLALVEKITSLFCETYIDK
ncbi:MAG: GSCFA domain-containing protein [Roseovarius confluentis]